MVIRSSGGVERLVSDLRSADVARREAAIARLRVIGTRAIDRLSALVASTADPLARVSGLKALDGIDDERVIDVGVDALGDGDTSVRLAAIAVLGTWVTKEHGTRVLDVLTGIALDRQEEAAVRLAALDALSELPRHIIQPVIEQASLEPTASATADEPSAAREWIDAHADAPLSEIHDVISRIRERERMEPSGRRRDEWMVARGAAHAVLARRGSRVALYDVREAIDAAQAPLPLDFLTTVVAIGDASCLEPMARAWAAAPNESWWRSRLADGARDIVHRIQLNARSAVVKRIKAKWPGFL